MSNKISQMSKVEDRSSLQTRVQELETSYERLGHIHTDLIIAHEELIANKNLLIETVLTKEAKEKKYKNIIENSPSALFLTKPDGRILEANRSACDMLGYTEVELKQIGRNGFMDHSDPALLKLLTEREKNRKARGEVTVIKKNGDRLTVDISSFVFADQATGEDRTSIVMVDITQKKQAELELQKSNEWANLVFNNTTDLMFLMAVEPNHVFRCVKVNPAYCSLTGLAADQVIGKTITEILPEVPAVYAVDQYDKAIKLGRTIIYEEVLYLPVGNIIVETKLTPVCNDAGECNLLLGVARNISERKKAEQIIQENDRRMNNAQYVGGVGDWEYDYITGETIWSDELFRLFGRDPGKGAPEFESFFSFYSPEDANRLQTWFNRAIAEGENFEMDLHLNLPSQPEAYHYSVAQVLRNDQGQIVKLYGIVQDITHRKLAEIKLNTERNQLRTLIDNLPDSIYIKDAFGRKIITNHIDLQLIGAESEKEVLGKTDLEIFSGDLGLRGYADDMEVIKTGNAIFNREDCFFEKDGEPVWLLTSKVPLRNELGEISGLLGIGRIVTDRKKSEEALKLSNERYVYATKATFDAIWDWDIVNDYLYWGEGYEKIFGYKILDKIENHINSFDNIHPDDRKLVFNGIDKLIEGTGLNWTCEYRYLKANKEYAYVQDKAIIIRDYSGKAVRMIGAMQDITERKLAEEAIKKIQNKFTNLINTVDGIVWEADAETFQFTFVSQHAEKILGYSTAQWINEPGFWASHIHPDDRLWAVDYCVSCTREKKEHQFEYRMIAANGEIVWLADFVTVTVEMDKAVQLQGIMVDITERKKAEQLLTESENYLRAIIETEPECIKLLNIKGELENMNPAGLAMIEADYLQQVKGKSLLNIINEPYRKAFGNLIINVFNGKSETVEFKITGLKGTHRWIESHAVPLKNAEGKILSLLAISRDITQRKKTDKELKEKNTQLKKLSKHLQNIREEERKFLAREVHDELGQLASVVKMDVDWLSIKIPDLQEAAKKRIHHASSTADLLINTIRKIAYTLRPGMLDDFGLYASLEWQCKQFTSVNSIPCIFHQKGNDENLAIDIKTELFRICQESLTNVMRHASATRVRVSIHEKNDGLYMCISDNGKGFDTNQKKDTLGLIGMRERTLSINGKLSIKSEPGKGTTICTIIPKNEDAI